MLPAWLTELNEAEAEVFGADTELNEADAEHVAADGVISTPEMRRDVAMWEELDKIEAEDVGAGTVPKDDDQAEAEAEHADPVERDSLQQAVKEESEDDSDQAPQAARWYGSSGAPAMAAVKLSCRTGLRCFLHYEKKCILCTSRRTNPKVETEEWAGIEGHGSAGVAANTQFAQPVSSASSQHVQDIQTQKQYIYIYNTYIYI